MPKRSQGRGQQAAARRGTDEGEGIEADAHGTGAGPLVDHDVDDIILHRGIEVFLHFRRKPVDLIDEEHVAFLERGEQAGQVAGLVEDGTGSDLHVDAHLVGDDMGEGRLAQAGRAMEKRMVQGFAAELGGFDIDIQIGANFALAGEIFQLLRPDYSI